MPSCREHTSQKLEEGNREAAEDNDSLEISIIKELEKDSHESTLI